METLAVVSDFHTFGDYRDCFEIILLLFWNCFSSGNHYQCFLKCDQFTLTAATASSAALENWDLSLVVIVYYNSRLIVMAMLIVVPIAII